jgi:hypothetical protein
MDARRSKAGSARGYAWPRRDPSPRRWACPSRFTPRRPARLDHRRIARWRLPPLPR